MGRGPIADDRDRSFVVRPFSRDHLDGVIDLFAAERWTAYVWDPERTFQALVSPGSTAMVAVDGDTVAGVAHIMSDGLIQAHLSAIAIAESHRGMGIGKHLLREGFDRAGGSRLDLISIADGFYGSITQRRFTGFRITRSELGLPRRRVG